MTGKVAIISGSSRGIGAGLVTAYRGQGWAVVAAARTVRSGQEEDLVTVAADVADPATPGRLIGATLDRFGRIDTLVNNVGLHLSKPFTDYAAADYAVIGQNLAGFFWLTQQVIAELATRYGGHVVSVLTPTADIGHPAAPAVLAALARGGQAAVTRSLALEYASRGIRVNAVAPGVIETPLFPAGSYDDPAGRLPPLGRAGQVSDVVNAVMFLESSPYITGEIVHVDGGLSLRQ